MRIPILAVVLLSLVMVFPGCTRGQAAGGKAETVKATVKGNTPATAPEEGKVTRIVFLDLEDCCECTRNRIDTSWNALQAALSGEPGAPPVQRIHMDSQNDRAAPYQEIKPVMVAPALYFLDGGGRLVSFLQGEVTEEQVRDVID